jgi:RNA polymerase sigma-70 factor (ECF subfamily)
MANAVHQDRFVALLEQYKRILYKVASSYCRNVADRHDLTQEIIIQLWRSFDRYDEQYRFSTWMYRIAMNVAISFYRSESRRTRDELPFDEPVLEIAAAEPESDDIKLLRQFIDGLDELNKALIILYLDGNNHAEIADVLGITATNVSTKIARIKERLRRDFETKGRT